MSPPPHRRPQCLNLLNSTVWGISLEFLNFVVFYKLACALTTFENHRTVEAHERHLISKMCEAPSHAFECAISVRVSRRMIHNG